jgi:O-antigen ligase
MLVGIVIAVILVLLMWLRKPIRALYAALFWVLLPLGIIPPGLQSPLNRLITFAAFGFWGVYVLGKRVKIIWNVPLLLMMAFILWSAITLGWTTHLDRSITILQAYILRLVLFLFIIPSFISSLSALDGLMNALAISGWVWMAYSLFTLYTNGFTPGVRFLVGDVNTNAAGTTLLITLIGVLWISVRPANASGAPARWSSRVSLVLAITLIAIGASRGSAISLFVTLLLFLFWKTTRPWGLFGLAVVSIAGIFASFLFATLVDRFLLTEGGTALGGREQLWQASWQLIWDHPWTGVGIGESEFAILPYIRNSDFFISTIRLGSAPIHNPVLLIWAETGIPGIVLYLGVLVSAFANFVRLYLIDHNLDKNKTTIYFALVTSVFTGYFFSWIKGGGSERDHLYFFLVSLMLLLPCFSKTSAATCDTEENESQVIKLSEEAL